MPADTICAIAAEVDADVIVIGSHGRTGVKRLMLGSTSEHVVRHAPCPVLVVREENPSQRVDACQPASRTTLAVPLAVRVRRERVAAGRAERARRMTERDDRDGHDVLRAARAARASSAR